MDVSNLYALEIHETGGDPLNYSFAQIAVNKFRSVHNFKRNCQSESEVSNQSDSERCQFQAVYNDLENDEQFCVWQCEEKKQKRGTREDSIFCVFHDRTQTSWDSVTLQSFEAKIEEHHVSKKPLFCIGYYFPLNITFNVHSKDEGTTYDYEIYLCDAEFAGSVEFSNCRFNKPFNLAGAIFRKQVLFRNATYFGQFYPRNTKFLENVNFRYTTFYDADFHDTVFYEKANFHDVWFYGVKTRFLDVRFQGKAKFENTKFNGETEFRGTVFREGRFSQDVEFRNLTKFRNVVFENGENTDFAAIDLSNVSFLGTDITRVKFHDDVKWGGDDNLTVIDERELKSDYERFLLSWDDFPADVMHRKKLTEFLVTNYGIYVPTNSTYIKWPNLVTISGKGQSGLEKGCELLHDIRIEMEIEKMRARLIVDNNVYHNFIVKIDGGERKLFFNHYPPIESVKALYRGLRENYEYRLRYDEAGKFFVREMDLKRIYNNKKSQISRKKGVKGFNLQTLSESSMVPPRENNKVIRNVLSVTGWYRILGLYGENLLRPVIAGIVIIAISTLFWLIQINPSGEPSLTNTIGFENMTKSAAWTEAFERSMADFIPLVSNPADVKVGLMDFIIKIVGGAVTFGLLTIGLRRKFERRFRH